uniref:Uncharacterized protein n=1 Tax=Glossina palpalis gambiensis TaxID=67801 RepID=A0A1B0BLS9_9MUSC
MIECIVATIKTYNDNNTRYKRYLPAVLMNVILSYLSSVAIFRIAAKLSNTLAVASIAWRRNNYLVVTESLAIVSNDDGTVHAIERPLDEARVNNVANSEMRNHISTSTA